MDACFVDAEAHQHLLRCVDHRRRAAQVGVDPVETLLELLSSGMTIEEILADYEDLERDDLLAVLAFAARLARTRRLNSVAP